MINSSAPLALTATAWTEILSDGGSVIFQGATQPILLLFHDSDTPALSYAGAFELQPHQLTELYALNLPVGQRLFVRAVDAPTQLKVAA